MEIALRSLAPDDRAALEGVLRSDDTFRDDEIAVALELIDDALARPTSSDYWIRIAEHDGQVAGYICFGPTPMTDASFDLYWIVVHARARGRGVAGTLVRAMEQELRDRGARGVRIETSQLESYGSARSLYDRLEYREVGRIPDFYRPGDDLITYYKKL